MRDFGIDRGHAGGHTSIPGAPLPSVKELLIKAAQPPVAIGYKPITIHERYSTLFHNAHIRLPGSGPK